jgi:MFS family permease
VPPIFGRVGRKPLLYLSGTLQTVSLATLGGFFYLKEHPHLLPTHVLSHLSTVPVVSLVVYIIAFSVGFGPLPWLLMGEMFPERTRSTATSIVTAMACLGGFVVTITFLDLVKVLNTYGTFWLFAIVSAVAVVFTFLFVPETKGRPLLENKPPSEEWINSPYLAREAQGMLL